MSAITVFRGDSFPLVYTLKNKDSGLPINIEGYSFRLTVSSEKDPSDTTSRKFFIDGTILDAAAGKFHFLPTVEDNAEVGKFFFDIQMTTSQGYVRTIEKDKYTISQDIGK